AVSVARNAEEAERIARGEDVIARREEPEEPAEFAAEDFFEPEAAPQPDAEEPEAGA
ncbi:MAG: 50S ribosomal protein L9, partial [Rhodoplanes sp.]